jgi:8-oxo-dGTP pyrophosphatase MutT (NUDIX family)
MEGGKLEGEGLVPPSIEKAFQKGVKIGYIRSMDKQIAKRLASRKRRQIRNEKLVPSAVLVLLLEKDGQPHVLFTRRSDNVEHHKGEISFPGGTVHPDDSDLLDTALREGAEEIGLAPDDVTILGGLDDISTVSTGFVITPYVGIIPYPYTFQINEDEVAELVLVPLRALVEEHCTKALEVTWAEKEITPYDFHYQGEIIWGATARILKQFLDITMDTMGKGHTDNGARGSTNNRSTGSRAGCTGVLSAKDKVPLP